ncbi:thioesterase family protein [Blastococcus sp. TML/M2B]|uniref:thioesterase family protein n=1 Tax=Blastococcus sp. TML/M2B TaxID=2798727 RepID=UPI00190DC2B7|nr:thioesterase family protein [Blastococcus sp. TML/M2B]MBN1091204.1 thioesterase family protein [Blastococcus sp. TML/M2B]
MTGSWTPQREGALFRQDGDLLVPGPLTRGPWYHGTLHGSAMLAPIARAAERHPSEVERQVVRLTVDMMRAAPMAPLRVETTTVRSGKSIDFVDVAMYADDELCVRGSALRMRVADLVVDEPDDAPPPPPPPADGPAGVSPFAARPGSEEPAFHHAIDVHVDVDAEVVWFRLAVPLVEGEENTGTVAVAAVADWTYAVPHLLRGARGDDRRPGRAVHAINADTTINAFRPLSGGWVGLRTTAHTGSTGAGTSGAHLYDAAGPLGFSAQSVLVRGPSGAPLSVKEM